jgi:predicted transcriptional regulator
MPAGDRVRERRKAAALARYYRDEEGLSIAEIARRLGRAEATVKAYLYDPSDANKRPTGSLRANAWEDCPASSIAVRF